MLLQVLQQNLDSTYDQLEQEKARSSQAMKEMDTVVSQLAEANIQTAHLEEDRDKLQQQLESLKDEIKVRRNRKWNCLIYW